MKGKLLVGSIIVIVLIIVGSIFIIGKKSEVTAASTILIHQPLYVQLTYDLDEKSIQQGVYVTNRNGDQVDAEVKFENKNMLSIVTKEAGEYVVHIEKKAIKNKFAQKQTVEFKAIKKINHIASAKDLEDYFQTVLSKEKQMKKARNSLFGTVVEESTVSDTANESAGTNSHSTTNNQVEGIEEGDIVVTDGNYIYSIVENKIVITKAKDRQNLKNVSEIVLDKKSSPLQLLLHNDQLIVIFDEYIEKPNPSHPYDGGMSMTKAAIYNIGDGSNPTFVREFGQEGYLNNIRKYKNTLYIVSNYSPNYWILSEEKDVELRPFISDTANPEQIQPLDVENISILPATTEPSYTLITAIDLTKFNKNTVETKGFLGGSSTLYMSENALYLTAYESNMRTLEMDTANSTMLAFPLISDTTIYKFAIDGTSVELLATTTVDGTVLNQFSMDEHNGYFRIATTEGTAWGKEGESKNHLFVLNHELKVVGEVRDLAKGERIYSARYMGDKAYIVTFKETDPLFVIDLENPEQPKVLGELKIPGFSNYLHPIGENHLLGIGYETESRVDEYSKEPMILTTGMKLSLFDITDFTNPKEQDTVVIGGRGTYSEIQHNHKALFRNENYHYFGFPITLYEEKEKYDVEYKGNGAQVYEVTAENGIQLIGDLIDPPKKGEQYEEWEQLILRLLYIDDTLYTVSRNEIKSYDLQTFNEISRVRMNE